MDKVVDSEKKPAEKPAPKAVKKTVSKAKKAPVKKVAKKAEKPVLVTEKDLAKKVKLPLELVAELRKAKLIKADAKTNRGFAYKEKTAEVAIAKIAKAVSVLKAK